ncbi:MAG: DUF1189 family protein [Rickettsiales bacterium]|nr:DUF1189 family protein [Rickettsiales bacterium]
MFLKRLIQIIQYSFCSKDFYIDLYHNVKGPKLQYFLIVMFVTNLAFVLPLYIFSKNTIENSELLKKANLNYIAKQLPESLAIKDYILEIPDTVPETIFTENKTPILGFAKQNNLSNLKIKNIPIIIAKDGTYILSGTNYVFISFSIHMPKNSFLSPRTIVDQIEMIQDHLNFIFVLFYVVATIIKALILGLNLLFFSAFGFLYIKILKRTPNFLSIYRIAIFSSFPSLIIEFVLNSYVAIINPSFLNFIIATNNSLKSNIVFFTALGYFYYALFHITRNQDRT